MGRKALTDGERQMEYAKNFAIDFVKVVAKAAFATPSEPWEDLEVWQMKLLISKAKRLHVNVSRQLGKSTILACKAFHLALTQPDSLCLFVAEQRQANEDIRKVRHLVKAYNAQLKERYDGKLSLVPTADNITSMEFGNGSRIIGLPANEKIRGFSAPAMVVIDEASRLSDEVFVAVDPMMTMSQGQLILASTPHGTSGFFYTESKNPFYEHMIVPWWESPRMQKPEKKAELELKRQIYGEAYVKQEYECNYLDDVDALFTERALRDSIDETEEVFSDQIEAFEVAFQ